MNINPVRDVPFDDEATLAMGAAFDQPCRSLRLYARDDKVRALIGKLIIEAAKNAYASLGRARFFMSVKKSEPHTR